MKDYAAAIASAGWVLYHYLTNRNIRRTLQRIANAVENLEDGLGANHGTPQDRPQPDDKDDQHQGDQGR